MRPAMTDEFGSVDLLLRIAGSPREFSRRIVQRDMKTLFMIDIRTKQGRSRPQEYFLLYCGTQARVRAIDVDRRHRQVLLDVAEPSSRLKTTRFDRRSGRMNEAEVRIQAARRRMRRRG